MFPPDLPPITNKFLYVYRVFIKLLSFFVFGLGSLILIILFFPPMRLFLHPRYRFSKYARRLISSSLGGFVTFMHIMGIVNLEVEDRKSFRRLSSKIVVANHPSLLDVIILFSLIPNADCIVNAYLNHGILRGIVRQLYILNSLDFNDLLKTCIESLEQGNCLIIFPEGTRTPRTGKTIVKKGAARIALASGRGIVPLHIGGTDKYGLGKKDAWFGFNPQKRYVYRISEGIEIQPEQYQGRDQPAAVRALTKEISSALFLGKKP